MSTVCNNESLEQVTEVEEAVAGTPETTDKEDAEVSIAETEETDPVEASITT